MASALRYSLSISSKNACRYSSTYVQGVHTKELGGKQLILDPATNQGMAFDVQSRQVLGMHGLLPPNVMTQEEQLDRLWHNFNQLGSNIEWMRAWMQGRVYG